MCCIPWLIHLTMHGISKTTLRLRQVDIKADHFERQAQNLERERDLWEKKFEVCSHFRLLPHVTCACMRSHEACYLIDFFLHHHRKHKRSTRNHRKNSTSSLRQWSRFKPQACSYTLSHHRLVDACTSPYKHNHYTPQTHLLL